MLLGGDGILAGNHTERSILRLQTGVPGLKCLKEGGLLPASVLRCSDTVDPPTDHQFFVFGDAFFVQFKLAGLHQVGEDGTALDAGQDGSEHGVAVG